MPAYFARDLPWTEVQRLAKAHAVALLPVGSTEAHGPHLPLSVDVVIAEEVCRRAGEKLGDAVVFPAVTYGLTDFAAGFSGTVSLSAETTEALLSEVLVGIAQHGFARIGVVNHHLEPAHFAVVHKAAERASKQTSSRIVVPDHRRKPTGPSLGDEFMYGGSHAGNYETSLMLAAAPHLVNEAIRGSLPNLEVDLPARIKAGAKRFEECGGPNAYFGTPAQATKAEGERLMSILVELTVSALSA
jgi:creatinine amidohydrolase